MSPSQDECSLSPTGLGGFRLPWLKGRIVMTLGEGETSITEHTGSFPVELLESALLTVVAIAGPSVDVGTLAVQAQDSVDNITFADVGSPLEVNEVGVSTASVEHITGTWLRLEITWSMSSEDGGSVVAELELRPQGEAKALSPDLFRQFMPLPVFLRDSTFKVVNPFVGAWMTRPQCAPASETGNGGGETKPLG